MFMYHGRFLYLLIRVLHQCLLCMPCFIGLLPCDSSYPSVSTMCSSLTTLQGPSYLIISFPSSNSSSARHVYESPAIDPSKCHA